jgi:hypothetical protein
MTRVRRQPPRIALGSPLFPRLLGAFGSSGEIEDGGEHA